MLPTAWVVHLARAGPASRNQHPRELARAKQQGLLAEHGKRSAVASILEFLVEREEVCKPFLEALLKRAVACSPQVSIRRHAIGRGIGSEHIGTVCCRWR